MESIKELRKICQSKEPDVFFRGGRFFSIYLTWFFLHFKITPNQLTFLGTIIFVSGAGCFFWGLYWLNLTGIFLLWLSFIIDLTDGEVARYRGTGGRIGGLFIEPMSHDIMSAVLFVPLVLGQYRSFLYPSLLIFLGFSATIFKLLFRLAQLRYVHSVVVPGQLKNFQQKQKSDTKGRWPNETIRKIYGDFGAGFVLPWLSLFAILDKAYLVIVLFGLLYPAVYLLLLIKQSREIKNNGVFK